MHKLLILIALLSNTNAQAQVSSRTELTDKEIPVWVGECSGPRIYKDTLERRRLEISLSVKVCQERVTYDVKAVGTVGRGIFKRTKYERLKGTERFSYQFANAPRSFDLSYEPDSYRGHDAILRDVRDACENARDRLIQKMVVERNAVQCK